MRLAQADSGYDLVVAGGGITGAGVFARALSMGYKALLVEQKDFAWGTSSRSSKMVHGGLRYLKQGRILLTRAAVKERERLLKTYPGLITPLEFLMPLYKGRGPSRAAMTAGLNIYSLLAGEKQHRHLSCKEALTRIPGLNPQGLASAMGFRDAGVDDARLVLRLIFDGVDSGGHALNYTRVTGFGRDGRGRIGAVHLEDQESGLSREIRTRAMINATGVFAETLHPSPASHLHIRPLRGSHLIFPGHMMEGLDRVVSFLHPRDRRPVFLFPWQGSLVLGTTDVDHDGPLLCEPGISVQEAAYLAEGASLLFPGWNFSSKTAVSAIAGIRPVLSRWKKSGKKTGKQSASKESREHALWADNGLVTVTGGKLTTFGLLARDALKMAAPWLTSPERPVPESVRRHAGLELGPDLQLALEGRLGRRLNTFAQSLTRENSRLIPGTRTCWAELAHGAAREEVRHLADLLLRRVRIGLLLPQGGLGIMDEIRRHTAPFLDWDGRRWDREIQDYHRLWKQAHFPGPGAGKP